MKIVYCVGSLSSKGGMEKVLANKSNYFVKELGYDVHIITQNQNKLDYSYSFSSKVKFHDININELNEKVIKGWTFIKNVYKLRTIYEEIIRKIDPDIIIVSERGYLDFVIPKIKSRSPKIREFHFAKEAVYEHAKLMPLKQRLKHLFLYKFLFYMFNKYNYLVLLTQRDKMKGNYNTKTIVIPNMVENLTHSLQSDLTSKRVISVGSMHDKRKNFEEQILIWKQINNLHPDWTLNIFGDGRNKDNLEKLILENNLEKSVFLHGNIDNINEQYLKSSIFLFTSKAEGLPMVLIEAQSFGLPIVSYNCPTGPSDIINSANGILINQGDKDELINELIKLIENYNLRKEMGNLAKQNSLQYTPEKIGELWNNFFKQL